MSAMVGIDPGLDGGIAVIYDDGTMLARPLPVTIVAVRGRAKPHPRRGAGGRATRTRRRYDVCELRSMLARFSARDMVVCERVQPMPNLRGRDRAVPGHGSIASFGLGYGLGIIEGLCAGLGIPCVTVPPRTWQAEMYAGTSKAGKDRTLEACHRLWPDLCLLATPRSTKAHLGMADAYLIAEWGRRCITSTARVQLPGQSPQMQAQARRLRSP